MRIISINTLSAIELELGFPSSDWCERSSFFLGVVLLCSQVFSSSMFYAHHAQCTQVAA